MPNMPFDFFKRFLHDQDDVRHYMYARAMGMFLTGDLYLPNEIVKVALMKSSFTFDANDLVFDPTHECSAVGYPKGGRVVTIKQTVGELPILVSVEDDETIFADFATIFARYAVFYIERHYVPTLLISCIDFGKEQTTFNGEFKITWSSPIYRVGVQEG